MQKPRIFPATAIVLFLCVSCIDRDILNVSDSLEIHSSYSLPVGAFTYNINGYLSSLDTVTYPWPDSLVYNDVLYPSFQSAVGFASSDTFSFSLVRDPSGKVKSVEIVILVQNGYPTTAGFQVYFLSGTSSLSIDSVFTGGPAKVLPADINGAGLVTGPSTSLFNVALPAEFMSHLNSISGIKVKGWVNTTRPDIQWVKFYSDYNIYIHIGSRIELQFNTSEL
jgi:hypothetical protein